MQCEIINGNEFVKKVMPLIDKAKRSIKICVFDWRWYPQTPESECQIFNQAIIRAKNRGVEIQAVVNQKGIYDILTGLGLKCKHYHSASLLHAKIILIDDEIVITGSHNYTQSAFTSNIEMSVILTEFIEIEKVKQFLINLIN